GFALMQGKTHRGSIFFRDGNENEIGVVATVEASPGQFMESSEKYEEDFMGLDSDIVNTPFVVTAMDEHPLYKKFQDPRMVAFLVPSWHTPGDRLINIPLRRGSKLYGFLILGFSDNDANLKNNDLKLLLITASQIAISLENIILLEEAKVAYDRLRDLQDQTIQLEKMATKGQMSAEIGHELNNFLNVVGGNLSQVKHQLDRKNYPEMEKYVNAVINNLGNIEKFTHGLMNFENMSLNFEFCDMNILIQGVIEYLRTQRLFQNVTIQLEKPLAPVFTMVDTGQMQQLLHNLINNAADATIGKTERLVSVVLTYDSENSDFTISVIDNGTGIDKGFLEKAFKARFTTKKTGHGFGLLVCKRIIDNHEAILNVDSSPGEGTTISINFPIKLPENKISTVK
ncbi:MAG: HAMP domain-containing sensor histidine kinase, partial [candidate division Zixibacteria bacterium]|nr:HAMP domain-containing sensor histidine kinase [candidate division Zixibacteria bacterium]